MLFRNVMPLNKIVNVNVSVNINVNASVLLFVIGYDSVYCIVMDRIRNLFVLRVWKPGCNPWLLFIYVIYYLLSIIFFISYHIITYYHIYYIILNKRIIDI